MSIRTLFAALILTVLVTGGVGMLFPKGSASALVTGQIKINPGGTWGYLTTTWHGGALDWGKDGGGEVADVYWRSWSYRSDTSTPASLGTITRYDDSDEDCSRVSADYHDNTMALVSTAHYTHTVPTGTSSFTLYGKLSQHYQSVEIAETVDEEGDECDWTEPHLHQYADNWFNDRTSAFQTEAQTYGITDVDEYQHWRVFTW